MFAENECIISYFSLFMVIDLIYFITIFFNLLFIQNKIVKKKHKLPKNVCCTNLQQLSKPVSRATVSQTITISRRKQQTDNLTL